MPFEKAVFTRWAARFLVLSACALLTVSVNGGPACAQSTACDPQYMDALEARAYLEAQREVTQNQNLILKPDSVFELTCFDQLLGALATRGGPAASSNFSESILWGAVVGQGPLSLDTAFGFISVALGTWLVNYRNTAPGGPDLYMAGRGIAKRDVTNFWPVSPAGGTTVN